MKKIAQIALQYMEGRELLTRYRRMVSMVLSRKGNPDKNLNEERRVRKELLKRLGGVSILVFTDYAGNIRIIGPFFNEEQRDRWLTDFWEKFMAKYSGGCIRELPTIYQNINLDEQPVDPETFLKIFVRHNGAHIVV